jgi:hypothetical protein
MKYRAFEQDIKHKLQDDEAYVDIVALTSALNKQSGKKRPIIWIISALVLSLMTLSLLLISDKNSPMNQSLTDSVQLVEKQNLSVLKTNVQLPTEPNTYVPNITLKEELTLKKIEPINLDKKYRISRESLNREIKKNRISNNNSIIQANNNDYININKQPFSNALPLENTKKLSKNSELINLNESQNIDIEKLEKLDRVLFNIESIHNKTTQNIMARKQSLNKEILCPTFSQRSKIMLSIIPEIGGFLPIKRIEQKQPDLPAGVFALRYQNEKTLEGISGGAQIKLQKEGLPVYIKSGIIYNRIAEKMRLSYKTIKRDTTIGIISITKSTNGDTITTIWGPIVKETETQGVNTKHYYLHLIDLPLSIGIEKNIGMLKISGEVGAMFNIGLRPIGNILATGEGYEDIKQSGKFKSSIGLSYFGGIGLEYPLTNGLGIYGGIRGRIMPNDFTQGQGAISQKYKTLGLNLGLVYNL